MKRIYLRFISLLGFIPLPTTQFFIHVLEISFSPCLISIIFLFLFLCLSLPCNKNLRSEYTNKCVNYRTCVWTHCRQVFLFLPFLSLSLYLSLSIPLSLHLYSFLSLSIQFVAFSPIVPRRVSFSLSLFPSNPKERLLPEEVRENECIFCSHPLDHDYCVIISRRSNVGTDWICFRSCL